MVVCLVKRWGVAGDHGCAWLVWGRVGLVFFGVWKGKRGGGGFFRFSIFLEGGSVAGQVFVLVCVKKEAVPLVCVVWR